MLGRSDSLDLGKDVSRSGLWLEKSKKILYDSRAFVMRGVLLLKVLFARAHGVVGYHAPLALRRDWERCPVQFRMCPLLLGTGLAPFLLVFFRRLYEFM
jgi:hypothetical protein